MNECRQGLSKIGNGKTKPSVVSTSDETTHYSICLTTNKNLHWVSAGEVWAKNCIFWGQYSPSKLEFCWVNTSESRQN